MADAKTLMTWGLEFDDATLTPSSEKTGLPVKYLRSIQPSKVWSMTGNVGWLRVQTVLPVKANTAVWTGHNMTTAATVRVRGGVTDWTTAALDTTALSPWPVTGRPSMRQWPSYSSMLRWDNDVDMCDFRIDVSDPTNPEPLRFGRIHLTKAFEPKYTIGGAPAIGISPADDVRPSGFGRTFTEVLGPSSRRWILPVTAINEDDLWDGYFEFGRLLGRAKDLFMCLDAQETTRWHLKSMQCRFSEGGQFDAQPMWDELGQCWRTTLTLEELV